MKFARHVSRRLRLLGRSAGTTSLSIPAWMAETSPGREPRGRQTPPTGGHWAAATALTPKPRPAGFEEHIRGRQRSQSPVLAQAREPAPLRPLRTSGNGPTVPPDPRWPTASVRTHNEMESPSLYPPGRRIRESFVNRPCPTVLQGTRLPHRVKDSMRPPASTENVPRFDQRPVKGRPAIGDPVDLVPAGDAHQALGPRADRIDIGANRLFGL